MELFRVLFGFIRSFFYSKEKRKEVDDMFKEEPELGWWKEEK